MLTEIGEYVDRNCHWQFDTAVSEVLAELHTRMMSIIKQTNRPASVISASVVHSIIRPTLT